MARNRSYAVKGLTMASLLPCTSGECISTARRRLGHTYEVSDGLSACMQRLANSLHDRKRLQVDLASWERSW